MEKYSRLFYLSIFLIALTYSTFEHFSFFVFQLIIALILFISIIENKEFILTKPSKLVTYICLILVFVGLIQAANYHNLAQPKTYFPFSLCPQIVLENINYLFTYLMLFIISIQLFKTDKEVNKFLYSLLILFCIVLVIVKIYPTNGLCYFFARKYFINDVTGVFLTRNSKGAFFSAAFFISLSLMLYDFLKLKDISIKNKLNIIVRFSLETILTFLLLYYTILSASRGALLATIVSLFIFLALVIMNFVKEKYKKVIFVSVIFILFILVAFIIYKNAHEINYYAGRINNDSEHGRLILYKSAFDMLKEYPLTGIGLNCSKLCSGYLNIYEYTLYLHNEWLEIILGYGYLISAIVFFLILLIFKELFIKLKRLEDDKKIKYICLCCSLLSFCISTSLDFHFHSAINAFLFFVILAMVCSIYFDENDFIKIQITKKNIAILFIFMILSLYFLTFQFKNIIPWRYFSFEADDSKRIEACLKYSKHPDRLLDAVYYYDTLTKINSGTPLGEEYKQKAKELAKKYLDKYPFNRDVTEIYNQT